MADELMTFCIYTAQYMTFLSMTCDAMIASPQAL